MATGTFNNDQASLPLNEVVPLTGFFPSRPQGGDNFTDDQYLGFVRTFAGFPIPSDGLAQGQALTVQQHTALYALLGTTYGGNGTTTFNIPNLGGTVEDSSSPSLPLGGGQGSDTATVTPSQFPPNLGGIGQPISDVQPSLAINYVIRLNGALPAGGSATGGFTGEVLAALTMFVPDGFAAANGELLSIANNPELYAVIGTTYGGNGVTNFAVPNLTGRDIVGAGTLAIGAVVGQDSITLTKANEPTAQGGAGATFDNEQPGLALNYMIDVRAGVFPSQDTAVSNTNYLGEVRAFAGTAAEIPNGWMLAAGQTLSITANQALFALLGTSYGGNGTTNFNLPDLRGRVVVGTNAAHQLGAAYGSNTALLTVTDATPCYCRGTAILTIQGERPVETLAIGDTVITAAGEHRPVKWAGYRSYSGRFLTGNPNAQPIRFRAGSLGGGLPRRDLLVSPEHAMYLGGLLIPARCLLNGSTIVRELGLTRVDYHHVELETHDVLLAEGSPSESFMDDDSRGIFQNAHEFAALYPAAAGSQGYSAPRVEQGAQLEAVRKRLAGVAEGLPWAA